MKTNLLKEKLVLGLVLLFLASLPSSLMFLRPTELERKFFFATLLLIGLLTLTLVVYGWKGLLTRTGYFGNSGERPFDPPSPPATRTLAVVSAIGGSLGVPVIALLSFSLGVPQGAFMHGLCGFLVGLLAPLGGSLVLAAALTYARWKE